MRKILSMIALMFVIFSWIQVEAFEVKAWEELDIINAVNGDLYLAGGRVDITAPINWDLIIAWGQISVNEDVMEDLTVTWWNIFIKWNVWDDVRVVWWSVRITSDVDWDLVVFGWEVRIDKDANIKWDLVVFAWIVILNWEIVWNALINAWQLALNWTIYWNADIKIEKFTNVSNSWSIRWNLKYWSETEITELADSASWTTVFEKTFVREDVKKGIIWFVTWYLLLKLIWVFLFSTLIFLYFEKMFEQVSTNLRTKTWTSFLYWFLIIIWLPVIIILLLVSIIWIPIWLFLLFTYIFIFVFLSLINTIVFSSFFIEKYEITKLYAKLLIIFWISIIFVLINWINIIVWFFTLWAIYIKKLEVIKMLRK